jgi:hypothetical protein
MISPPPAEVGLVFDSLEASSRVAHLEAEIAQLRDALARRQPIGVATQRFAITPSGLVTSGASRPKTAMSRSATTLWPSSTRTAADSALQWSRYSA